MIRKMFTNNMYKDVSLQYLQITWSLYIKKQQSAIQQSVDAKLQPFRCSILVPHGNTNYVIMHLPTCSEGSYEV